MLIPPEWDWKKKNFHVKNSIDLNVLPVPEQAEYLVGGNTTHKGGRKNCGLGMGRQAGKAA